MARARNASEYYQRLVSRRQCLWTGAVGLGALTLPRLLAADALASAAGATGGRAKRCILFFLEGGPSHIDLWDMKPEAPAEVRGEFQPIASSLPGVPVCEHLPRLARHMHRFTLIRSIHHQVVDHNAGAYYCLTGRSPVKPGGLIVSDEPGAFPPFGSVLAHLRPTRTLPPYVLLPDIMYNNGHDLPGQRAGFLGSAYDPLVAGDPSAAGYRAPGLALLDGVSPDRLADRRALLSQLNGAAATPTPPQRRLAEFQEQAYDLLTAPAARQAFDLEQESPATRERYGLADRVDRSVEARKFGGLPHLGQCMLLARRLIEAGVRLVTVGTGRGVDQTWDTHRDHFPLLKQSILPYVDRAFAALLDDLAERDLLDDTLVVAMGEFGRTPKLGQVTSSAGAAPRGRDHWPHCYTGLLAGGGVAAGHVHGASDRFGAYPERDPVTPEDVTATIYAALGIAPATEIHDTLGRPYPVSLGAPITGVLG